MKAASAALAAVVNQQGGLSRVAQALAAQARVTQARAPRVLAPRVLAWRKAPDSSYTPRALTRHAACGTPCASRVLVTQVFAWRAALVLAVCLACLACFVAPTSAFAKSYTCPSVNATAQAQTDGSLHVIEQRTFSFDGSFSAVWWTFHNLPWNAEVAINSVRMAAVDAEGNVAGEWQALDPVAFQIGWRDEGGPSSVAWSYDSARNTVYAFFDESDAQVIFELDYTVENGVQVYDDIAEVYWKYVAEDWEVDSENVSATIELPVPSGVIVEPGDNVRAWGHGPLDGTVSIAEDGTVSYEVSLVRAGQYAEARVVFPVSWLTNLDTEARLANQGTTRLDSILAEEKAWTDQANNQRMNTLKLDVGLAVCCAILLLVAVAVFMRFGREHKPDFTDKYWRDVPHAGMQPAVVGRLWRWNHESTDDLAATILHLASKGVLRVEASSSVNSRGKRVADYLITRDEGKAAKVRDPLEAAALRFLFDEVAEGEPSLSLSSISAYGTRRPQAYVDAITRWQAVLTEEVARYDFFEKAGYKLRTVYLVVAAVMFLGGLLTAAISDDLLTLAFTLPTAAALGILGNYMPRRSEFGNNVAARAKALRNWMRDASASSDFPPADSALTSDLMVYAYLFGVSDKAACALRDAIPDSWRAGRGQVGHGQAACESEARESEAREQAEREQTARELEAREQMLHGQAACESDGCAQAPRAQSARADSSAIIPWYVWYMTIHAPQAQGLVGAGEQAGTRAGSKDAPSLSDALGASVHKTYDDARSAVVALNSSPSNAGGFGGGFSMGGGGGFGAGGGAR